MLNKILLENLTFLYFCLRTSKLLSTLTISVINYKKLIPFHSGISFLFSNELVNNFFTMLNSILTFPIRVSPVSLSIIEL